MCCVSNQQKLISPLFLSPGNRMGGLRANGPQVLHGNGPDPPGGLGPVCHSQRLVQAVPYLFSGRPQHRTPHQTPLSVLSGERHQPLMHLDTPNPPTGRHSCCIYTPTVSEAHTGVGTTAHQPSIDTQLFVVFFFFF